MAGTNRVIFRVMIAFGSLAIGGLAPEAMARHDPRFHLEELNEAIEAQPLNSVLFFERGEIHRALHDYEEALADYDLVERLDPDLYAVHLARGWALYEDGRAEEALPALERFLACAPTHGMANLICARALASLGFQREADEKFARALAGLESRQPEQYLEWARCREQFGAEGAAAALEILDRGIEEFGPIVSLQLPAVDLELKLGHADEALRRIDVLMAASQRRENWLYRKGRILADANRPREAADMMRQTLEAIRRLPLRHANAAAMQSLRSAASTELQHLESPLDQQAPEPAGTEHDE